jgi:hypothetical protein
MIKTRIAATAAFITFGLASFGGAIVAVAAPANADDDAVTTNSTTVYGTAMTGTAGQSVTDARQIPEELADATRGPDVNGVPAPGATATGVHLPFPNNPAPHSEHNGQGHKGSNEAPTPQRPHSNVPVPEPIHSKR